MNIDIWREKNLFLRSKINEFDKLKEREQKIQKIE